MIVIVISCPPPTLVNDLLFGGDRGGHRGGYGEGHGGGHGGGH